MAPVAMSYFSSDILSARIACWTRAAYLRTRQIPVRLPKQPGSLGLIEHASRESL